MKDHDDIPGHDHGGLINALAAKATQSGFEKALEDEQSETKILRNLRRRYAAKHLADQMGLEGTTMTSVKGDLMGQKGQAFAIPGANQFYYSRDDWTPGVMAHELGHLASGNTGLGKAYHVGRTTGQYIPTAAALTAAYLSKGKMRKGALGLAAASALTKPVATYLEEVNAWKHGDKALDSLQEDSMFYDEAAREAAKKTKSEALKTYALGGGLGAVTAVGAGHYLGKPIWNHNFQGLPAKYKGRTAGTALALALGTYINPFGQYETRKQLAGEGEIQQYTPEEIALSVGGENPKTDTV